MRVWKNLIKISVLLILILGYQTVEAQQDLAQQAYGILEHNCSSCHGEHGTFTEQLVIRNSRELIDSGAIIPGNPDGSKFYQRLIETDLAKRMPLNAPPLTEEALGIIHSWIQAGAPDWTAFAQRDIDFITPNEVLETIENHVESLAPFDRAFARYFTLTHLYNAGETTEALRAYSVALSKLVNSLSWGFEVKKPTPIDPRETIFHIDLRHYEWDVRNEAWTQIELEYPYSIDFDPETQAGLLEKLTNLREEMRCEVPFVHVDWFLAEASLPPLYHDILDLPETDRELERDLDVNVARNIQSAPGVRVLRAGFNDSGVSNNNRVVERHTSRYGAYWKSYDFAGSVGSQHIFTHPLSFTPDGGEIIFNLPNGLQAYYISDDAGNRIDVAPTTIVSNPAADDPAVRNGLSCIGCHTEGMKTFEDTVRASVQRVQNPTFDKEQALRLYVEQSVMDARLDEDKTRYETALRETGGIPGGIEPVHRFHEVFHDPLNASYAAAAVGLETDVFLQEIREKSSLQNLGLTGLIDGGNVQRDTWTDRFDEVIAALNSPDDLSVVLPVIVDRTQPTPTGAVYIPDANLRAAIEETLGKAPGASIATEDMARLTRLDADERGIRDLTGLEYAINLERIEFRHNAISDLSPLAGLTRLNNIKLRGNRITDVSPLADLTNVDWLGLEQNAITDLSPLKRLIKLNGIGISGNPVSDVSSLASLTSLERIDAWRTPISDFSSLAKLPRLRWIEFGNDNSISTLPSLKGLKGLRRLEIHNCNISDLSPLAELTQLEWLELINNLISDVSSLRNLTALEHLNLDANIISDVSPLAKLTRLKLLYLENNVISDVSPLAGFKNLDRLDLRNNAISDFSPLEGLPDKTFVRMDGNPGVPAGGPKITGPWLWAIVPGTRLDDRTDFLSRATRGAATELKVATNGAKEGKAVGNSTWTLHRISATNGDNINRMTDALGWGTGEEIYDHIVYGSVVLDSPEDQQTTMFVGSDDAVKVWLNGELVHKAFVARGAGDYQDFFPVTLKQGKNVLLVALDNRGHGGFSGFFGFAPDAKYEVFQPGISFSLSTDAMQVEARDTFTVHLKTENVDDLVGWQSNITFDPTVLKAKSVSEGDFLKQGDGRTFFEKGTIDNTTGKITGLKTVQLSKGEMSRQGTLLSIEFTAITDGRSPLTLDNFQAGSRRGEKILSRPPDIIITVGDPPSPDVSDTTFSLSTDVTPVPSGDTFTLHLNTKDITDLAGWQADVTFNPTVLEAVEVNEGDFLKAKGGDTFFPGGTIDNAAGKITGLSTARFGNGVTGTGTLLSITFKAKATGEARVTFDNFFAGSGSGDVLSSADPQIVITVEDRAFAAWDVNQDGQVNVLDLIIVAQHLGSNASVNRHADVNGDGMINVLDLIVVAKHLGESTAAAPSGIAMEGLGLDPAMIQAWIARAQVENDGSLAFQQGIAKLEQLLALFIPEKTALLPNYPNPFNPETWIPYDLAESADVTVHIYAINGVLVRTLALGYQTAGIYQYRSRAAYWDGKNEIGESVASGVYFYTLTAGDFTATKKMLIRK